MDWIRKIKNVLLSVLVFLMSSCLTPKDLPKQIKKDLVPYRVFAEEIVDRNYHGDYEKYRVMSKKTFEKESPDLSSFMTELNILSVYVYSEDFNEGSLQRPGVVHLAFNRYLFGVSKNLYIDLDYLNGKRSEEEYPNSLTRLAPGYYYIEY